MSTGPVWVTGPTATRCILAQIIQIILSRIRVIRYTLKGTCTCRLIRDFYRATPDIYRSPSVDYKRILDPTPPREEEKKEKKKRDKRKDRFSSSGAIKALSRSSGRNASHTRVEAVCADCAGFGRDQGTAVQASLCPPRVHFQAASAARTSATARVSGI